MNGTTSPERKPLSSFDQKIIAALEKNLDKKLTANVIHSILFKEDPTVNKGKVTTALSRLKRNGMVQTELASKAITRIPFLYFLDRDQARKEVMLKCKKIEHDRWKCMFVNYFNEDEFFLMRDYFGFLDVDGNGFPSKTGKFKKGIPPMIAEKDLTENKKALIMTALAAVINEPEIRASLGLVLMNYQGCHAVGRKNTKKIAFIDSNMNFFHVIEPNRMGNKFSESEAKYTNKMMKILREKLKVRSRRMRADMRDPPGSKRLSDFHEHVKDKTLIFSMYGGIIPKPSSVIYRKMKPAKLEVGMNIFMYVPKPHQHVVGYFEYQDHEFVKKREAWDNFHVNSGWKKKAFDSKFKKYKNIYVVHFSRMHLFKEPVPIANYFDNSSKKKGLISDFRYVSNETPQ